LSTQANARRFPPMQVTVYVRDTEKDAKKEQRLNEGISAATAATFAPVARGRRVKIWDHIMEGMAYVAAGALGIACLAAFFTLPAILMTRDLGQLEQPFVYVPFGLAVVLGIAAGIGCAVIERRERFARLAAAERALPYLGKASVRISASDDHAFTHLFMKLRHARLNAQYTPAREAELLAAIRALADYRCSPAPDPIGKQMNGAAHFFSDRAVKKLAKEFRAAEAAKAAALVRATTRVDRFARTVEDENLVTAARKRVAAPRAATSGKSGTSTAPGVPVPPGRKLIADEKVIADARRLNP
jgi:hypothetical protein